MLAVPYAEGLLVSYTAKHPLSKREKIEWYFCFCLKKQIHTITTQTNAGSGMYKHLHFQLKCQHFWACCPKQSGVWVDTSSWIDFCTLRSKSASQKRHSSWPFGAERPRMIPTFFSAPVLPRGPRWEGETQGLNREGSYATEAHMADTPFEQTPYGWLKDDLQRCSKTSTTALKT